MSAQSALPRIRSLPSLRLLFVLYLLLTPILAIPQVGAAAPATTMSGLHVVGNQLRNGAGHPVRLLGVNRAGTEYMCINDWGIFDGPSDATSVAAIAAWHVNTVRVPLNEHCWLGLNGISAQAAGAYRAAIRDWVTTLRAADMAVILDLHLNAAGDDRAVSQKIMADADYAPAFWSSVAAIFGRDTGIVFDLYNEPRDISWPCWRDGGSACGATPFAIAGMQRLVDAVRSTGATNVLMLGGLGWANDLSQWLAYRPIDPLDNIAAAWHVYAQGHYASACQTPVCWDMQVEPVAAQVPLIAGEIGQQDCGVEFVKQVMTYLDGIGGSYVAWAWNAGQSCTGFPSLIVDWDGTPSGYGRGFSEHLASVVGPSTPKPTSAPSATPNPSPSPTSTIAPGSAPLPSPSSSPLSSLPPIASSSPILHIMVEGEGSVAASNYGPYSVGHTVTLRARPEADTLLLGWRVDEKDLGWSSSITLRMDNSHTVIATFARSASFLDVPGAAPAAPAVAQLAARGIVRGYPDGRFGVEDHTLRAQMAALIARAMGWDGEDWGNPFADRGPIDASLWRNVGTLAHYSVAHGFGNGQFVPTESVLQAQTVSFITRAMIARGWWESQADEPALYPNVPTDSGHRGDIATFVHYAGPLPDTLDAGRDFDSWDRPTTRGWFAVVLWQALNSYFGTVP